MKQKMATNDEDVKKTLNFIMNKARADQLRKDTDERVQSIKDAKKEIAKQIFDEMDKYKIWHYFICSRVSHTGEPENNHKWFMRVELTSKEYKAIKNKYGVD